MTSCDVLHENSCEGSALASVLFRYASFEVKYLLYLDRWYIEVLKYKFTNESDTRPILEFRCSTPSAEM